MFGCQQYVTERSRLLPLFYDGIKYATASAPPCEEDGVAQVVEELLNLAPRP
jgi:hypothetical protein